MELGFHTTLCPSLWTLTRNSFAQLLLCYIYNLIYLLAQNKHFLAFTFYLLSYLFAHWNVQFFFSLCQSLFIIYNDLRSSGNKIYKNIYHAYIFSKRKLFI